MNDPETRFFVLTGGPGSGKTTLAEALHRSGFSRVTEAGRAVIREQVAAGGRALPWCDPARFAAAMLRRDVRSYRLARLSAGPVFFDRGVVDTIGYLRLSGRPVPPSFARAAGVCRYHPRVFLAPPWEAIYAPDSERKQDFAEAVRTYDAIAGTYRDFGYELVTLPCVSVERRVSFVLTAMRDPEGLRLSGR